MPISLLGTLTLVAQLAQVSSDQTVREFQYNGLTCLEETQNANKEIYCGDRALGKLDLYGSITVMPDTNVIGALTCIYESQGRMDPPWKHRCTGPEPYGRLIVRHSVDRSNPSAKKAADKFKELLVKQDKQ